MALWYYDIHKPYSSTYTLYWEHFLIGPCRVLQNTDYESVAAWSENSTHEGATPDRQVNINTAGGSQKPSVMLLSGSSGSEGVKVLDKPKLFSLKSKVFWKIPLLPSSLKGYPSALEAPSQGSTAHRVSLSWRKERNSEASLHTPILVLWARYSLSLKTSVPALVFMTNTGVHTKEGAEWSSVAHCVPYNLRCHAARKPPRRGHAARVPAWWVATPGDRRGMANLERIC